MVRRNAFLLGSAACMLLLGQTLHSTLAFSTAPSPLTARTSSAVSWSQLRAFNSDDNDASSASSFDISKPVFDIYAFRQVRGDALAKYNTLNQSEPLRINLFALITLLALSFPSLAPEVTAAQTSLNLPQTALCGVVGVGSAGLFVRECQRRNRQLKRFEKEMAASALTLQLPATSALGDALFIQKARPTIRQAQRQSTLRILAVRGTTTQLQTALPQLQVLGKRLIQSSAIVVPVPTDGNSQYKDWNLNPTALQTQVGWLAAPGNWREWKDYFESLGTSKQLEEQSTNSNDTSFQWFGLSAVGRSFGSGSGSIPSWLQLMGQHLRPTVLIDADVDEPLELKPASPPTSSSITTTTTTTQETAVLQQLSSFYHALTTGNLTAMQDIFLQTPESGFATSQQVTDIVKQGGRLDPWNVCLEEGNRPAGMQVANADVTLFLEDNVAYSTVVEFPDPNLIAGGEAGTPSLLAVQTWKLVDEQWKLVEHQTIPWSDAVPAAGTLVCDGRGCVSLVRGG